MKRIISISLSILLMMLTCFPVSAAYTKPTYLEEMYQINFTDIDVVKNSVGELTISAKDDLSVMRTTNANNDVAQLLDAIAEFPSIEAHMLAMIEETGNSLCAISITEVPLAKVDDHYERISSNARVSTGSTANGMGKFSMYTLVGVDDSNDPGIYVAWTCGSWSKNSFLGGENYPDAGYDYVLQSSPSTFVRYEDSLSVHYNTLSTVGVEGENFWRENGNATYVRYALQDDPPDARQCDSFILATRSYGPLSNGEYRQINSYYVHTWKQLTISVAVAAGISPERSVGLEITPSLVDKCWQVYNYVTFNF